MRSLLGSTALGAIMAVSAAVPASAQTSISTAVTTPQSTSASGDITITSTGSVKPTTGAAVTLNTNNFVRNEGTIQVTGANDSTGILANSGVTGEITNSGTITLDESFTPTDTDNDGDLDGPSRKDRIASASASSGRAPSPAISATTAGRSRSKAINSGGLVVDSALGRQSERRR